MSFLVDIISRICVPRSLCLMGCPAVVFCVNGSSSPLFWSFKINHLIIVLHLVLSYSTSQALLNIFGL